MDLLNLIDIDLSLVGERIINIGRANRLWIPPVVLLPSSGAASLVAHTQVTDALLAIRFSREGIPLPWGIGESLVNAASGPFEKLYVTVLAKGATNGAHLYLHAGINVTLAYGNVSGLSPSIGGNNTSDVTPSMLHNEHITSPFGG